MLSLKQYASFLVKNMVRTINLAFSVCGIAELEKRFWWRGIALQGFNSNIVLFKFYMSRSLRKRKLYYHLLSIVFVRYIVKTMRIEGDCCRISFLNFLTCQVNKKFKSGVLECSQNQNLI